MSRSEKTYGLPELPCADVGPCPRSPIDWRPIETCPKDGNAFLAYGAACGERFEVVFYDDDPPGDDLHLYDPAKSSMSRKEWCWGTQDGPWLHRSLFTLWAPLEALRPEAARATGPASPQGNSGRNHEGPSPHLVEG